MTTNDIRGKTIYIPYMNDHAYTLEAAFKAQGRNTKVIQN